MKTIYQYTTILLIAITFILTGLMYDLPADDKYEDAVDYLIDVNKNDDIICNKLWKYIKEVSHKDNVKKAETLRIELIKTIKTSQQRVAALPGYNNSTSFRDAVVSYLKLYYNVLNEDYAKIADLKKTANQSYDDMEAYFLAKKKAKEKLNKAVKTLIKSQAIFTEKNNIAFINKKSTILINLDAYGKVMKYYNSIYLICFKNNKQEVYLIGAVIKNDINAIEQNRKTLIKYSKEGLKKISKIKEYKDDDSLIEISEKMFKFYKKEAEEKIPVLINFLLKKEEFNKIKNALESMKDSERTQEDIDRYNKKVEELNDASKEYDSINKELNEERNKLINLWDETVDKFIDTHIPK